MKQRKTDIWLVIKHIEKKYVFTKYFDTDFEKDKYKRTALLHSIRGGHIKIVSFLLTKGAEFAMMNSWSMSRKDTSFKGT